MLTDIKAVIFDMDGVLIDSEPLWRQAMISRFVKIGIPFSDDHCRLTTGLRFKEVADFWFSKHDIKHISIENFEKDVINDLCQLIKEQGKPMKGVSEVLSFFKQKGFKMGIGTSSNEQLMNTVLEVLQIRDYFGALSSAEHLEYGKPHPHVFLHCAKALSIKPNECLVIEDSLNGIIAGKAAKMKVVAVPEEINKNNPKFAIADYQISSLLDIVHTSSVNLS
jgi:HAD superfamily hydrolase (TIGR01509 family)